jgi:hypothetical protein
MTGGIPPTPELREEQVRKLIAAAQGDGGVRLAALSAIDLCVMGGPRHPYFDEPTARAWLSLSDRRRQKAIDSATSDMIQRGLLTEGPAEAGSGTYSMSPELGVVLAARTRPSFIITNQVGNARFFQPALFALGDSDDPVRGIVVESPAGITEASLRDPLAAHYAYALLSLPAAARFLAEWVLRPVPPARDVPAGTPRVVTRFHPANDEEKIGYRLSIRSDGTTAQVTSDDDQPATDYDAAGLQDVMLGLISGQLG